MKKSIIYPNLTLRILIAAIASFYILFHGRSLDIKVFASPLFYVAFTVSWVIAVLMVEWVNYVTKSLDKYNNWFSFPVKRMRKQLIFGIFVPLLIDFCLISIYFYFLGTNIFENGFIKHDFPVIVLFVFILNFFYATFYLYKYGNQKSKSNFTENKMDYSVVDMSDAINDGAVSNVIAEEELKNVEDHGSATEMKQSGTIQFYTNEDKTNSYPHLKSFLASVCTEVDFYDVNIQDDLLYFYSYNKQVFMVNREGKEFLINTNLNLLEELFAEINFARINRSVVLNLETVAEDYETGTKRDTLSLVFFNNYLHLIEDRVEDFFIVTKNYIKPVTRMFDKF